MACQRSRSSFVYWVLFICVLSHVLNPERSLRMCVDAIALLQCRHGTVSTDRFTVPLSKIITGPFNDNLGARSVLLASPEDPVIRTSTPSDVYVSLSLILAGLIGRISTNLKVPFHGHYVQANLSLTIEIRNIPFNCHISDSRRWGQVLDCCTCGAVSTLSADCACLPTVVLRWPQIESFTHPETSCGCGSCT